MEISAPRMPRFKLQLHARRVDIAALLTTSGRCCWYLRVIAPGSAPVVAPMEQVADGGGVNVWDPLLADFNRRVPPESRGQIAAHPALAFAWKRTLLPE